MRKPFITGNWKMFKTVAEARHLVSELVPGLQAINGVDKAICPPFTALLAVRALLEGTEIGLGAQNMYWEASGAFTGEISPLMLAEFCQYVIIGHSERRIHMHENDTEVNKKVRLALQYGLVPIICVGEKYEERQAGKRDVVIMEEVANALKGVDRFNQIIIAYEPIWVIGRGEAIDPNEARSAIGLIRYSLKDIYPQKVIDQKIKVLYGGSIDDKNITDFVDNKEIQGVLVGGSSMKPDVFIGMINNLSKHIG
ncbi:MAG: triose-phosphate isomerase [Deltaproteobacteria bacterium]|nr:triose-phosphate isomerase [Deltaproteobacteria bacterium]